LAFLSHFINYFAISFEEIWHIAAIAKTADKKASKLNIS